jgi:hypothetical protein
MMEPACATPGQVTTFLSRSKESSMPLARALCCVLLTAPTLAAPASAEDGCPSGAAAESAVRRVLDDFATAYVARDVAKMGEVLGEEFTSARQRSNLLTRAEFLEAMKGDPNKNVSITRADERLRQYGCTVIATHRTTRLAERPNVYRVTDVLNFRNGRWQLVSRQVTLVEQPSPAPSAAP